MAHMQSVVRAIATTEHNSFHPQALEQSADYLEQELANMGYAVHRQEFAAFGRKYRNLVVVLPAPARPGNKQTAEEGSNGVTPTLVVGAHYDSAKGSPGANDNATGVASLLELARHFKQAGPLPYADLMFVLYANEEPPFFGTDLMGSKVHARALKAAGVPVIAMLSLETMGCYLDAPGSQKYPPLLSWLYPSQGDFIAFVGDVSAYPLVRRATGAFREVGLFPAEGISGPRAVPGIDWSDHQGYSEQGYPALMVTDTAPYRYVHYHTGQDTFDKVNFDKLLRVTDGLKRVLPLLAQR